MGGGCDRLTTALRPTSCLEFAGILRASPACRNRAYSAGWVQMFDWIKSGGKVPEPRKGMASPRLDEAEFKRRFRPMPATVARRGHRIVRKAHALSQFGLMRAEPGWPGTLKRLPVSVTLVPSTRRIEKSRSE